MHVYFSGIGGTGLGPLALIAHKAGHQISGSDKQQSPYTDYLKKHGITDIHIGQSREQIAKAHSARAIDWLVYTSALPMEQPDAPELRFCEENGIKATRRDEFLSSFLDQKGLKLIAIAGTHGKTTTTAMAIWLFKQLGIPQSYSVGAKLSFGDMGEFNPDGEYFVYEADEFDRNFLAFHPYLSVITGVGWDHPDIYPTREEYNDAFRQFLGQSEQALLWDDDAANLGVKPEGQLQILQNNDLKIDAQLALPGRVNRLDAWQAVHAVHSVTQKPLDELLEHINRFPGVDRRFEQIAPNLYSDYAHTPPKIRGALQLAREVNGDNVVVVYEGLHNTRQHFIKDDLKNLFEGVKKLYVVPSYLAREDPRLKHLTPEDLKSLLNERSQTHTEAAALDGGLEAAIRSHTKHGDLVLCITAGGGNSLDAWMRQRFSKH